MFRNLWNKIRELFGGEPIFLCDTCRYDHGNACTRRERPNATRCTAYKSS